MPISDDLPRIQKTNKEAVCRCGTIFIQVLVKNVLFGSEFAENELCPQCQAVEDAEVEKERQDKAKQDRQGQICRGIPAMFKEASIANCILSEPLKSWIEKPDGFCFVYGRCGTGKSYLSSAITMQLRSEDQPCNLVFSADLFLRLRASFNDQGNEFDIIEEMSRTGVTIFDDIGAQKISEYVIDAWYTIIDRRYRECCPTMFTSNLKLSELSLYMTDRVASRLASGLVVELPGKDKRLLK